MALLRVDHLMTIRKVGRSKRIWHIYRRELPEKSMGMDSDRREVLPEADIADVIGRCNGAGSMAENPSGDSRGA